MWVLQECSSKAQLEACPLLMALPVLAQRAPLSAAHPVLTPLLLHQLDAPAELYLPAPHE